MTKLTTKRFRLTAAAMAMVLSTGTAVAAQGGSARSAGPDFTYESPNPLDDATATVLVVHTGNGKTHVTLHVRGVAADPGTVFGAHVHQKPCGPLGADAGGHYQHAGATGNLEQREVWLDFSVNAAGNGHSKAVRPWSLDETTQRSVVIHAMPTAPDGGAGARLACIDLDGQS